MELIETSFISSQSERHCEHAWTAVSADRRSEAISPIEPSFRIPFLRDEESHQMKSIETSYKVIADSSRVLGRNDDVIRTNKQINK